MASGLANSIAYFLEHPIARRQRWRVFKRLLAWQAVSRFKTAIRVPWIEGTVLVASRGMKGATGNIYYGLHEFPEMCAVLHLLRPGELFVDGGANIGAYSVLASAVAGAQTVAFEPDREASAALRRNVDANGIRELVVHHQIALGDTRKLVNFTTGLGTMNRVASDGGACVQMAPLDAFDLDPTVIKLDIEGGELDAIRGAFRTLRRPSLLAVITEDHLPATAELLHEAGFRRFRYDPFARELHADPRLTHFGNALFVRDESAASSRLASARHVSVFGERV